VTAIGYATRAGEHPADVLERVRALPVHPWRGIRKHERLLSYIEDYLFIGGDAMSAQEAAVRLGVTPRSVTRWRAVLRAASGVQP
jgi:hypothetical protein